MFFLVFFLILALYGAINFWIGLRAWQGLFQYLPLALSLKPLYWVVFTLIAFSYIWGRVLQKFLPAALNRLLALIGAYWLAAMFYLVLLLLLLEFLRLGEHFLQIIPAGIKEHPSFALGIGLSVLILVVGILTYGTWNARHPRVQHYELTIPKSAGNLRNLHIVMVSDIHLGTINQNTTLTGLVQRINELNPDLVLFAGDVLDENVEVFVEQKMADTFRLLKSKYGVYAALGNHEYIGGHAEEVMHYLGEAGVKVLRDQAMRVANSFYVIGRDDLSGARFTGRKRAELGTILEPLDRNLPLILLDHQPSHIDEAEREGVDLQLSGHTHRGQLWPNNYITARIFPQDWGLLQKGTFNLIVSSGYGTWGPPIRIGNHPEIVDIHLNFAP